jgi:CBS domain-containing protein
MANPGRSTPHARVADLMSSPLLTCPADVPVSEVAGMMARHSIHAVVVRPSLWASGDSGEWGVISDLDLVGAAAADPLTATAGSIAAAPPVMVAPDDTPWRAAELMAAHAVTHLLVGPPGEAPEGIVSALDLAAVLAPPPPPERDAPASGGALRAVAGDRLVIRGHHLGEPDRDAEILEARGDDGAPPFLVRWSDDGRVSLFYPGSDAHVDRIAAD